MLIESFLGEGGALHVSKVAACVYLQSTICSLACLTFTIEQHLPQYRLQSTFILLLTTVTFKFVVNNSLPRINYLTYMASIYQPVHFYEIVLPYMPKAIAAVFRPVAWCGALCRKRAQNREIFRKYACQSRLISIASLVPVTNISAGNLRTLSLYLNE